MQSNLTLPQGWTARAEPTVASTNELLINEIEVSLLKSQNVYLNISNKNTTVYIWWSAAEKCWVAEILEQQEHRTSVTNSDLQKFVDEVEPIRSRYAFLQRLKCQNK